jgi:uncharacterized membrane protein YGL010W
MRTLEQHITQYAAYHRDQRNINTHFVGIPMIVFGAILAFAQISLGPVHAGWLVALAAMIYYLILDRPLGFAMVIYLFITTAIASLVTAKTSQSGGLIIAAVVFVLGWALQFLGHKYEGVKPAFVDDIMGLAIGPLFLMTEFFFMLRLKSTLKKYVEDRVGPVMARRDGAALDPASSASPARNGAAIGPVSSNTSA